ncbi:MAG: TatD family hydrolase [Treponema sp.]|jgi:TatD DNase family protein|nr:TatD family hydrolase [Treponema sp.]
MFSDTHFHFNLLTDDGGTGGSEILSGMAADNCFFAQDIGVAYDDLPLRQQLCRSVINGMSDKNAARKILDFMYFSAGIWPSPIEIRERKKHFPAFKQRIAEALLSDDPFFRKVCAVGECGLDHHWNPSGADGRSETDFTSDMAAGERELFCMQLELADELQLPVIVHSRDAAEETIGCISDCGSHNGVIHCFSYGIEEARAFIDRGWYISFSGSVTYTKKNKMAAMEDLLRFIPRDRLLLETDAPYLAPVPFRGHRNSPLFIRHTYRFVAEILGTSVEQLCETVDRNARSLFIGKNPV